MRLKERGTRPVLGSRERVMESEIANAISASGGLIFLLISAHFLFWDNIRETLYVIIYLGELQENRPLHF